MKNKYPEFRQILRERQAESQALAQQIRQTSGKERMLLWEQKRQYGSKTRVLLLAYACLRGVPYKAVERKCHMEPTPSNVSEVGGFWYYMIRGIQEAAKAQGQSLDSSVIKAWLTASQASEAAA